MQIASLAGTVLRNAPLQSRAPEIPGDTSYVKRSLSPRGAVRPLDGLGSVIRSAAQV